MPSPAKPWNRNKWQARRRHAVGPDFGSLVFVKMPCQRHTPSHSSSRYRQPRGDSFDYRPQLCAIAGITGQTRRIFKVHTVPPQYEGNRRKTQSRWGGEVMVRGKKTNHDGFFHADSLPRIDDAALYRAMLALCGTLGMSDRGLAYHNARLALALKLAGPRDQLSTGQADQLCRAMATAWHHDPSHEDLGEWRLDPEEHEHIKGEVFALRAKPSKREALDAALAQAAAPFVNPNATQQKHHPQRSENRTERRSS